MAASLLNAPQVGIVPNALPELYLSKAEDGGVWLCGDYSTSEATGRQRFLAHIPQAVLEACVAAKEPQGLHL